MTTVIIEDGSPQAKKFVACARTLPFAKVKRERKEKPEPEFNLYESLNRAFADVRLMNGRQDEEKNLRRID